MERHEIFRELIRNLERKLGALDEHQLSCCSISLAQCHALVEIGRKKTVSLIQLSDILELEKSTVSRTVEHLVKAGLVKRDIDSSNRRYITITLSKGGEKLFNDIEKAMNLRFMHILQNIPKNKQDIVMDNLKTLINAIQSSELKS